MKHDTSGLESFCTQNGPTSDVVVGLSGTPSLKLPNSSLKITIFLNYIVHG